MTLTHRTAAIPTLLSLALLALYLAFPTKVYYWDGILFAQAIEDTAAGSQMSLAHPNHLIYNFVGYYFYRLLLVLGLHLRALTALRILNSVMSAACAAVMFAILRDTLRSLYLSACLTLLFALSATWWKFSTDANAYIPSVFFLLVSFYLVLPNRKPAPLLAALSFFAAMCFHQLAVLAYPVFALGVYLQDGALPVKRRLWNTIAFLLCASVLIFTAYALLFHHANGDFNVARLLRWTVSYSPDANTRFEFWSNLGYSLRGQARLFFGGRLNLLRGLMNPAIVLLIVLLLVAVLSLILAVLRNLRALPKRWREARFERRQKIVLWLAFLWLAVYLVFLFFWLPQNTFYRLFYLPSLVLLLGGALSLFSQTDSRRSFATACFVIAVGLANFLFLIYPFSHDEKYPPLAFALQMNREWPPGTVVYYAVRNSDEALVRYFTPETVWKEVPSQFPAELPRGTTAWLETTAISQLSQTPAGAQWLQAHARPESLRELNNGAYLIRFIQVMP
ncbi:MAG TPA: hypothetical protein VGJ37_11570 [Pyrinomonadaceae bacterium]|jgi:hypothetical protein